MTNLVKKAYRYWDVVAGLPYRIRLMGCLALTELIFLCLVLFWPVPQEKKIYQDIVYSESDVELEDMRITEQKSTPPPPETPQVPVPVPNDQIIEEDPIVMEELDLNQLSNPLDEGIGNLGSADKVTPNPQLPPSVQRVVEPVYADKVDKLEYRIEIDVTFLVNKDGEVEEASISQIRIYDEDDEKNYRVVNEVDFGLMERTLDAALKWKFRPAKDQGNFVNAYVTHEFGFGRER